MKLPDTWLELPLAKIVLDMQPGFAQAPGDESSGTTPQIRTHNVSPEGQITLEGIKSVTPSQAELEKYSLISGDIVFNNTNSEEWVGKTAVFQETGQYVFSNHITRIRVNTELVDADYCARYLHFLWAIGFSRNQAKRWVSQAAIDNRALARFELLLPTIIEQQRIVQAFKQAEELARTRAQILIEAKSASNLLFRQMFVDGGSRWETQFLGTLVTVRSSLLTPTSEDYGSWPCIGPDSIESNTGQFLAMPTVDEVRPESGKYLFEKGDVLYSKIRPGLAKVALAECKGFCSADMYPLSPGPHIIPTFLKFLLLSEDFKQFATRRSGRAQMPKLNREQLLTYRTIVPPIEAQSEFEKLVNEINESIRRITNSQRMLDQLVYSMMIEAFSGRLSRLWRDENIEKLVEAHKERPLSFGRQISSGVNTELLQSDGTIELSRPRRVWATESLSGFQRNVHLALYDWKATIIPNDTEAFDDFCRQAHIKHGENVKDRIRRVLEQLAAMGLIAKISLRTENGDFVAGFRPFREEEYTRLTDVERITAELAKRNTGGGRGE